MSRFVPGLELCRNFYAEVVAPAVGVRHGAALLGPGSDVLGYDTERSTDHDWGPRCQVFVQASDLDEVRSRVLASLPKAYGGRLLAIGRDGERLEPHVVITTLPAWLEGELGWDLGERELTAVDWLLIPQTRLLGITQGAVFADPDGDLAHLRQRLVWFPDSVWWWLLACQWQRLSQEEPFIQRTAEVGDQVGSAVLAGRLVRDCMRLALLIGRRYAPYSKWLGTAAGGVHVGGSGMWLSDVPVLKCQPAVLESVAVPLSRSDSGVSSLPARKRRYRCPGMLAVRRAACR